MLSRFRCFAVVVVLIIAGCGGQDSNDGVTLNRGLAGEFSTLDPHKASTIQGHRILVDLYEGLLRHSGTGELENALAKQWSISEDGLEYVFQLHEEATWSNGDPITAMDFEYAFKRLVTPGIGTFYATFMSGIENASEILDGTKGPSQLGVVAVDEHTLVVKLNKPLPYFPELLTHPATSPIHRPSIERHGGEWVRPGNLVSSGAYVLKGHVLGSHVVLARNQNYREKDAVSIDTVQYFIVVNDEAMYNRYRAGELHITPTVPSGSIKQILSQRPNELQIAPLLGVYYYGFNMADEVLGTNQILRAALSMAIDREAIARKVTGRGEMPAYGWVPPGIGKYERWEYAWKNWPTDKRISTARRLYREAGFSSENPARFELRYNTGINERKIAIAVQSMWQSTLGAEVTLHNEEFKVLLDNIQQRQVTDVFRLSWVGDYSDPTTFLELLQTGNSQNLTGFSDETFDAQMNAASVELDVATRMALFRKAESIALEEYPVIPIYYYVSKHLVSPEVIGWKETSIDFHPSRLLALAPNSD